MAKTKKYIEFVMWVVGIVTSLGIGGLFIGGGFQNTILLSWAPAIIHTIVGWLIVASAGLALLHKFKVF